MAETVAMIFVVVGGIVMLAIPIWARKSRQDLIVRRARQEAAGVAVRSPLSAGDRAAARTMQKRIYEVAPWGWFLLPWLLLVAPIVAGWLGALIALAALAGFIFSIESKPADEAVDALLATQPDSHGGAAHEEPAIKRLPWFAWIQMITSALLLPVGIFLLLSGSATAGVVVLGAWLLDMALAFPFIAAVLEKRDRASRASAH